jgi:hypothetical protein
MAQILTKEAFIDRYCARSLATRDIILARMDAYPCDCGDERCLGWQMLSPEGAAIAKELGQIPYGAQDDTHRRAEDPPQPRAGS